MENVADEVEKELRNRPQAEVESKEIGELVMERLADIDEVAYVRFASVYRQFKDISVFLNELEELVKPDKDKE